MGGYLSTRPGRVRHSLVSFIDTDGIKAQEGAYIRSQDDAVAAICPAPSLAKIKFEPSAGKNCSSKWRQYVKKRAASGCKTGLLALE